MQKLGIVEEEVIVGGKLMLQTLARVVETEGEEDEGGKAWGREGGVGDDWSRGKKGAPKEGDEVNGPGVEHGAEDGEDTMSDDVSFSFVAEEEELGIGEPSPRRTTLRPPAPPAMPCLPTLPPLARTPSDDENDSIVRAAERRGTVTSRRTKSRRTTLSPLSMRALQAGLLDDGM